MFAWLVDPATTSVRSLLTRALAPVVLRLHADESFLTFNCGNMSQKMADVWMIGLHIPL